VYWWTETANFQCDGWTSTWDC